MKLATIEKISEVIPHPNADRLTIYKMEGMSWKVISGEKFNVNDLVVYIKPDTVVPDTPTFEFLRPSKFKVSRIRLRGEYSNGLILPLSVLPESKPFTHGDDVTDILGVKKYEKPVNLQAGDIIGSFPTHLIPKTDEENVENYPDCVKKFKDKEVYVTLKSDGSSVSFINDVNEGFLVCSRNNIIKESETSKYWVPVFKYNLREKLPKGYAIQAELIGEKIQKNPEGIKGVDIKVFNVWEIGKRRLLGYDEMVDFCNNLGLPIVVLYYRGAFKWNSSEEMLKEATNARYSNGNIAEGLVWRPVKPEYDDFLNKELSVKTLNYQYKE